MKAEDLMDEETVTEIVKRRGKGPTKGTRPDRAEYAAPHCAPGEISRMLSQAVTITSWPKIDTNDAGQVNQRIDQYFQYCIQNDMKPDVSGLALALGVNRHTLWKWENGVESNKPQEVRNALKRGREINELLLVQMMNNGKINPIPAIFLLKNNHQYKDQTDVVVTPNNPFPQQGTGEIKEIIQALPEPDDK